MAVSHLDYCVVDACPKKKTHLVRIMVTFAGNNARVTTGMCDEHARVAETAQAQAVMEVVG